MIIKLTTLLSSLLSLSLSLSSLLSLLFCTHLTQLPTHTINLPPYQPPPTTTTTNNQQIRSKKQKQEQEINFYWKKLLMKEPESGIDVKKIFMHRTSFYSFVFCFCCAHFELRITFFCFFLFYYFITATCHKLRK